MTKYRIIVNPISGRGTGEASIPGLQSALADGRLDFDLVRTERPWHAAELAREAALHGYQVVVAVGGDGTANEVLNGLMQAKEAGVTGVAMAMVAVGRGNDFSFGMDVPQGLQAGIATLLQGRRRKVDVGRVTGGLYPQGRYFGNGVGIGFDAVVGFEALKLKRLSGFPSYIVAALKTIFLYFRAPLLRIEYDGNVTTQNCLMVSTMNGRRQGGGFMMAPQGKPDDGLFDLCIAGQVSRAGIFALLLQFMKGTQATHPKITTARARKVAVTALEGALPAHSDGETLCVDGKELTMELIPHAIEVISQVESQG
jgi:diacylglycerol kinase (ATP)